MKEATSELNLAVIVCISVGILAAFFFGFLWPMINENFQETAQCRKATCDCSNAEDNDYMCECWIGDKGETFECPFGG